MKQKLLNCGALLGDSLYLLKPIDKYLEQYPDDCAGLIVLSNLGGDLVRTHFEGRIPVYLTEETAKRQHPDTDILNLDAGRALNISLDHYKKHNELIHVSQAYAYMLGVNCDRDIKPPLEWVDKLLGDEVIQRDPALVVLGPFSSSCMRHSGQKPNKTLDDWKWEFLIRYFKRHGYKVVVGAAPDEVLTIVSLPISSYRSGTLLDMVRLFKTAGLVVTLDNGQSHIASACNAPTIILQPSEGLIIPPEFIAPMWSDKTTFMMLGDVNTAQPAEILYGVKVLKSKMEAKGHLS